MTAASRSSELHLTVSTSHGELLRSFIREAALADDVPPPAAGLLASDGLEVWNALCATATGHEHARVSLSLSMREARLRLALPGHARFAGLVSSLGKRLPEGSGLSCREIGIDGWEISLHRTLAATGPAQASAPLQADESPGVPTADAPVIDLAQRADAPGIARCFLSVYGHHYVHSDVFSPKRYWARVEDGELISVVARDRQGEIVGHLALERQPGGVVAERGEAVVLASHRGHHLLERMTDRLSEEAPKHGLVGVYAEPLTIHTFSQRNDVRSGMPICAVLLGANPEDFRPKDLACPTAGQRQSYLRTFRFVQPPEARSLQDAGPYREVLQSLYGRLGVTARPAASDAAVAPDSLTGLSVNDRGYGLIKFERAGRSCAIELAQSLRDVLSLGARSVQLQMLASDPGVPLLIAAARRLGFFFCGLGPAFAQGQDLLLLQYLTEPLDTSKLQLLTDETKQLVAFIEADRKAVATGV